MSATVRPGSGDAPPRSPGDSYGEGRDLRLCAFSVSEVEARPICSSQIDNDLLGLLVRHSPIAIVVTRREDGRVLDANDSFLRLFGYSRDEVIGESSTALGIWSDSELPNKLLASPSVDDPRPNFASTMRTKSGADVHVLGTVSEAEIEGQRCLLSQLFDIGNRCQTDDRFRGLTEQVPVVVYAHALDDLQTIKYISPQINTFLGYTPEEVLADQP